MHKFSVTRRRKANIVQEIVRVVTSIVPIAFPECIVVKSVSIDLPPVDSSLAGGRALIPKIAFGWPILAGLFHARVGLLTFFLLPLILNLTTVTLVVQYLC